MTNWRPYLDLICKSYARWWQIYTFTDVIGCAPAETATADTSDIPFLDLGLMAWTIEGEGRKAKGERERDPVGAQDIAFAESETNRDSPKEKIERFSVLDGLRKYAPEHVLLVGRPGSGKSTSLLRLLIDEAKAYGEEALGIPLLVELRYFQTSIEDLIRNFLKQHGLLLAISEIEQHLFDGNFLLLIDGVNELPSEDARRQLRVFHQTYGQTPMVFTTRELGLGGNLGIEKKLEMQPLSEQQMRQFVNGYLSGEGEKLLKQLKDRLRSFGQTPLLLWMLCSLFKATGEVPSNLGLVFRQFTQSYEKQLRSDVPVSEESRRWWPDLLKTLAFTMTEGDSLTEIKVALNRSAAEVCLAEFLESRQCVQPWDRAKEYLEDLLNHHLIQIGVGNQIEFRHQLIQEYYTAEWLLERLEDITDDELKRHYLNYLKWTEPSMVMLALLYKEQQAIRVVKAGTNVDLVLGAKLSGVVQVQWQHQATGFIKQEPYPIQLRISLWENTGSEMIIPGLLKALEDADSAVRRSAANALEKIGSDVAIPGLLKALEDADSAVRRSATDALGRIGSDVAIPGLLKALEHANRAVRWSAADALEKIGSEAAIPGLLKALEDADNAVRWSAADALGKVGSDIAIPGLLKALEDADSAVRRSAANALEKIGSEAAIPGLLKALEHANRAVRWSAANALGKVGSDIAIPGLLKALEDVDSAVRRSAANALEKIGSDIAIPGLLKALEDADRDVRRSAADVLGKIGSEISPVQLINFLKYRGVKLRLVAAEALGIVVSNQDQQTNLTQALTIVTLISALKDRYPGVRRQAVQSLQKIQNPKSIKLLQQLQLEVFNPEINQAIIGIQEACQFYNYQLTQPSLPIVPTPKTINQIDFAILTAIEPERLALCTALKITNADRTRKDARTYWHKRLPLPNGQHYDIILTQAPDMANVDAALLAADTLNHWQPHAILMVGIAAAAGRDQQLGDLILGKDVYYYERGKATASGVLPEPVMYRSDATLWNRVTTTPNHDFDIHATRPDGTDIFPNVSPGVIASGEQVIAHAAARDDIAKGHRKIKAIEMEGYGVSAAAWQRFDPVRCLVIRALCDYADGEKNDDWHAYAAAVAAGFTKHFLMDMPLEPRNP